MPQTRNPISAQTGLEAFLGGIGFVISTPSVWGYALVPVVTMLVLASGFAVAGILGAYQVVVNYIPDSSGLTQWGLGILVSLLVGILGFFLSMALAQPLSGWALEAIARKQTLALTGRELPELGSFRSFWLSLRCSLFTLLAGGGIVLGLFVVTLVFPPAAVVTVPLKVLVAAGFLTWDLVDCPLGMRGCGVRQRIAWVREHLWACLAFGVAWMLVLLIPGIVLLVLPFGIAGATRLVIAAEANTQAMPPPLPV